MTQQLLKFNEKIELLSEDYNVIEREDDGNKRVIIEGLAITFEKPTRNRVCYTYESGSRTHNSLVGKPFLDSHIDKSIHNNPPFGHVIETWIDKNPKNNLPALFYRVDVDPMEETFIRKLKRKDIPGVSVQILVDSIIEKQDMYGDYIQANIREFLELSAVLIPGDGDTTMKLVESFNSYKEDLDTSNGNAVMSMGGVLPKRKVIRKDPETEEPKQKSKSKIFEPNPIPEDEDDSSKSNKRLIANKMEDKNKKSSENFTKYEELFTKMEGLYSKMESFEDKKDEDKKVSDKKAEMTSMESLIRKVLKEELKGTPERETSVSKKAIGPNATQELPQTTQPANGTAPSGGKINSDDKLAEDEEIKNASKPKSDYKKPNVQKNSLNEAKTLIEKAKEIMKEFAKGDDVTAPQPGRTEEEPHKMDDAKPKKGSGGFEEAAKDDKEDNKEDEDKDEDETMKKMFESLQNEIKSEKLGRKSLISTQPLSENLNGKTLKDSVKEYLTKL